MMRDEGDPQRIPSGRDVSRRTFVKTAGVAGAAVGLAGCTVGGTETSSNSIRWISSNDMAGESAAVLLEHSICLS